jgi:hypothetical protein
LRQRPSRYAIRAGRNFTLIPRFPRAQTIPSPRRAPLGAQRRFSLGTATP